MTNPFNLNESSNYIHFRGFTIGNYSYTDTRNCIKRSTNLIFDFTREKSEIPICVLTTKLHLDSSKIEKINNLNYYEISYSATKRVLPSTKIITGLLSSFSHPTVFQIAGDVKKYILGKGIVAEINETGLIKYHLLATSEVKRYKYNDRRNVDGFALSDDEKDLKVYVSHEIETLPTNLRNAIRSVLKNQTIDIIYTNNINRYLGISFKIPKFTTIKERDNFCKKCLVSSFNFEIDGTKEEEKKQETIVEETIVEETIIPQESIGTVVLDENSLPEEILAPERIGGSWVTVSSPNAGFSTTITVSTPVVPLSRI